MSTDTNARLVLPGEEPSSPPAVSRPPGGSIWDDGTPTPEELDVTNWLLTTTRSNRKTLDMDRPVPLDVIEECLEISLQAPTAHNTQRWHWIVVDDRKKIEAIADVYRRTWLQTTRGAKRPGRRFKASTESNAKYSKIEDSTQWFADNMHRVPLMVVPCVTGVRYDDAMVGRQWVQAMEAAARGPATGLEGRVPSALWIYSGFFATIYPAVWQFQLALRARGLGSTLTVNHLANEDLTAEILELPGGVTQACLLPVAYTTKRTFKPALRQPLASKLSYNTFEGTRE
ncbi:nitroreductase family protein [Spongisporangium articulatum]|uniref:Nitroreductase family protein n=1 Tax=Spongisporangium articulatum TaxID=3362603 RepID=A0ABW8AHL0_9ACTN